MQFRTAPLTHVFVLLSLCPLLSSRFLETDFGLSGLYADFRGPYDGSNGSPYPTATTAKAATVQQQQHQFQHRLRQFVECPCSIVRLRTNKTRSRSSFEPIAKDQMLRFHKCTGSLSCSLLKNSRFRKNELLLYC